MATKEDDGVKIPAGKGEILVGGIHNTAHGLKERLALAAQSRLTSA